jgi:hypothetical protein
MGDKGVGKSQYIKTLTSVSDYKDDKSILYKCTVEGKSYEFRFQECRNDNLIPVAKVILYLYDLKTGYKNALAFANRNDVICPVILLGCKYDKTPDCEFIHHETCKHMYISNLDKQQVESTIELIVDQLELYEETLRESDMNSLRKAVPFYKITTMVVLSGLCATTLLLNKKKCYNIIHGRLI